MDEKRVKTKERDEEEQKEVEERLGGPRPVGAEAQIKHLADFLLENFQTEFGAKEVAEKGGEGAGEMAVRLLRRSKGRLVDELEVRRLLEARVNGALRSFIRGMFHEYEVVNMRVKKEHPEVGPSVLVYAHGEYVKLNAPNWLREKLLGIADTSGNGSWAVIEDPKFVGADGADDGK